VTVGLLWHLADLDHKGEAMAQIEAKVREVSSALRFVKDSKIGNFVDLGMTCSVFGTVRAIFNANIDRLTRTGSGHM
jgi:hypothetical protein